MTSRLEPSLLTHSTVAVAAVLATLEELAEKVFRLLAGQLCGNVDQDDAAEQLDQIESAIVETRNYMSQVPAGQDSPELQSTYAASLHILDHLARLIRRIKMHEHMDHIRGDHIRSDHVDGDDAMRKLARRLAATIDRAMSDDAERSVRNQDLSIIWDETDQAMEPYRKAIIGKVSRGTIKTNQAIENLDTFRWLRRVAYHVWRIAFHLDSTTDPGVEEFLATAPIESDPDAFSQSPS